MLQKKSGEYGIDDVINEDKLGLGKINLQAKRDNIDHLVGSPEIQTGALSLLKRASLLLHQISKQAIDLASR